MHVQVPQEPQAKKNKSMQTKEIERDLGVKLLDPTEARGQCDICKDKKRFGWTEINRAALCETKLAFVLCFGACFEKIIFLFFWRYPHTVHEGFMKEKKWE